MKKYEFTLSFMKPQVWVSKIVVEAFNLKDAYYEAFYQFAMHIRLWNVEPNRLEISYVELKEGE